MINNEIILRLKFLALKNAQSNTIEWFVEQCYRYYSRKYYTSLLEAKQKITPHEVVLIYFEDFFMQKNAQELLDLKADVVQKLKSIKNKTYLADLDNDEEDVQDLMEDELWVQEQLKKIKEEEEAKNRSLHFHKKNDLSSNPTASEEQLNKIEQIVNLDPLKFNIDPLEEASMDVLNNINKTDPSKVDSNNDE